MRREENNQVKADVFWWKVVLARLTLTPGTKPGGGDVSPGSSEFITLAPMLYGTRCNVDSDAVQNN